MRRPGTVPRTTEFPTVAAGWVGVPRLVLATWLLWVGVITLSQPLHAQEAHPTPVEAAPPAFELRIAAPASVQSPLSRHLDMARYRTTPDLTAAEIQQLANAIPANAQSLLAALGHFSPTVQVTLATEAMPPLVQVSVDPGPASTVGSVNVLGLPDGLQAAAQQNWPLPVGQAFTQAAWDTAKADTLNRLTRQQYPAARIVGSLADVDAENALVHLYLELDTGPAFTLGPAHIEGLQRYDAAWVHNMLALEGVRPGAPYHLAQLQAAQQRLAQSGYFDSVYVQVDPTGPSDGAPVQVLVKEQTRGKLALGVGGSTDLGPRLSAEYTHRRLPFLDAQLRTQLKLERDARTAAFDLGLPADAGGWQWSLGAQAERLVDNGTLTRNQRLQLARTKDTPTLERRLWLQWDQSAVQADPLPTANAAAVPDRSISLHHRWNSRQWHPLPFPSEGHALSLELGGGWVTHPVQAPFAKAHLRWKGLYGLGQAQNGRLALRAEGGAVLAASTTTVPDAQQFLTGGDQSVRGYASRSIGITGADGTLRAGRILASGSVEWQRPWLDDRRMPTPWESTVFVDGGAVAKQVSDLKAHWGIGTGVRYRTPVGPIQADLAYGAATRRWRLHLNLGFVF